MRRSDGFSLIEVLIGLAILALVLTVSLAVFLDRERRLRNAEEIVIAHQALANEIELYRHTPYATLTLTAKKAFESSESLLATLPDAVHNVEIRQQSSGVKALILSIQWNRGKQSARLTTYRSDTGGGDLW